MTQPSADIAWSDGAVPVSRRFDDPYYSRENGLDETRHVFLAGNGLPERFRPGFHLAELGFGTGLTLCTALQAWIAAGVPGRLHYTGFEAYPLGVDEMQTALAAFPPIDPISRPVLAALANGSDRIETDMLSARIIIGDARETLPAWSGRADAWCLDGFAPARNPELWEAPLLAEVARHTAPGGTVATYSAAGCVRRGLEAAGFVAERVPGYGRKRHMTVGRRP